MNTLALIQKKLKAQAKVEAYNKSVAYRGVTYVPHQPAEETHGTFVYRGHTYTK